MTDFSVGLRGNSDHSRTRRTAVALVLGSAVAAVVMSGTTVRLLQDQLHVACGFGQPGTEGDGTWSCADGISYLWIGAILGGMTILIVVGGSLIAGLVRHEGLVRTGLLAIAAGSVVWVLGWTWVISNELVYSLPPGSRTIDFWYASVFPAAIACGVGLLLAAIGLMVRRTNARMACGGGAVALTLASVLQPGLAINTIPAAALMAAAVIRTPPTV